MAATSALYQPRLIYARASRTAPRSLSVADLLGKRVAITNGYEYGTEFDSNNDIRKEVTSQSIMGLRMLLLDRVEYALAFEKVAQYLLQTHADELAGKVEPVGLAAQTSVYCVFSRAHPDGGFFSAEIQRRHGPYLRQRRVQTDRNALALAQKKLPQDDLHIC